jgi:PAS domain S-box-containing protein
MDTDRNLLFAVLALQVDLLDRARFVQACTLWTAHKDRPIADLLIEQGWLTPDDRADVERLLDRKLKKHGGDVQASLTEVANADARHALATMVNADVRDSIAAILPLARPELTTTVEYQPTQCQRYMRTRLHATGGIGRIWLAHDSNLRRDVALKEIRPERVGDAGLQARFLQEARITGQLEHPGIVPVYELIRQPGEQQSFYTMRFVNGRTLSEAACAWHEARRAGQADSLAMLSLLNAFAAVCNTVAYAHSRGVIHRDLKGQNVVLGDFGEVVVLDWGLAKLVGHSEEEADGLSHALSDADGGTGGLTLAGQTVGTPAYMAPEQAAGRPDLIDRHTDVYGLGAVLYEILTGQAPFSGADTATVLRRVQAEAPVPPHHFWPEVPPALETLCLRALAKRLEDRPTAAGDLAREVQGWQEFERRKAEEALRRQTEILESILNSMSDGAIVADETGRFLFWNPAAERLMRNRGENVTQAQWQEHYGVYLPDMRTPYPVEQMPMSRAMRGEEVDEDEAFIRHDRLPEGAMLSINARPLRDKEGTLRGGVIVIRDVTAKKKADEELRKIRERFELAVQGSQDGLWDWDVENDRVWYSDRMRQMLGYDEEEFPNRPGETEKRVHPEDHANWRAVRDDCAAGGADHHEWEYRIRHKDGSYRWVRDRSVVLRRADGKVYRVAGSREDITERKRSEEELAYEQYLLRSLMDTLPEGIYFKDRESRIIRANRTVAETLWCLPAQLVGKTDFDLFTPKVARQSFEDEQEIIRTGRPIIAKEEKITWREGPTLWVSTTKMPLRDPDGQIIGTFGITRDITKRKLAEETLRESEERYRSVIAAMQDGIAILDPDGTIRDCNAAAERILGLSADQIMGRTPHDPHWRAIHEDGSPFPGETHPPMVTLRTGQPCRNVIMGIHQPDGSLTWITVNSQPLFRADGRTLAGAVASFEDITERERAKVFLHRKG